MIATKTYQCLKGCCRESAAPLDKFTCCFHGLPWSAVEGSDRRFRMAGDPPGTPLIVEQPGGER